MGQHAYVMNFIPVAIVHCAAMDTMDPTAYLVHAKRLVGPVMVFFPVPLARATHLTTGLIANIQMKSLVMVMVTSQTMEYVVVIMLLDGLAHIATSVMKSMIGG